jgi:hypothetical protein
VGFGALVVKKDLTTKTLKRECHQNSKKKIGGNWCFGGKKLSKNLHDSNPMFLILENGELY